MRPYSKYVRHLVDMLEAQEILICLLFYSSNIYIYSLYVATVKLYRMKYLKSNLF